MTVVLDGFSEPHNGIGENIKETYLRNIGNTFQYKQFKEKNIPSDCYFIQLKKKLQELMT